MVTVLAPARIDVVDPSTGRAFTDVPVAGRREVDEAVEAAVEAFATWRAVPIRDRHAFLTAFVDGIEAHADELRDLETRHVGKLTREVGKEIPGLVAQLRAFGDLAEAFEWEIPASFDRAAVVWEPIGVVASLLPWNAPLNAAARRIAVTIATGTTTVIKASSLGPLTPLRLAEITNDAGLPKGVVSVLVGPGEVTGRALLDHPAIAKVSFTGSEATGRDILRRVAPRLLPVAAEMGGKAPQIVFPDAPWEAAQAAVLRGFTRNAGQICTCGTRLLVHEEIADRFTDELVERAAAMRVGPATDPASDMGPQISESHRQSIHGFVERARAAGRNVATGGETASGDGFFYRPTVVMGVRPEDELFQEEVFGPVLAVTTFRTAEEAVELSNATRFGFVAGIWSADEVLGARVAAGLVAGTCWLNTYWSNPPASSNVPRRNSGTGAIDAGAEGLREWIVPKQVVRPVTPPPA